MQPPQPHPATEPATPTLALLPPDHPDRAVLAAEVHARPPQPLQAPCRAIYVAVQIEPDHREAERQHLDALCRQFKLAPPPESATQWSGTFGDWRFKWERHGEFSSYTVFAQGLSETPFATTVAAHLPAGWLQGVPGVTLVAARARLEHAPADGALPDADGLARYFGTNVVMGASIGDGVGMAYTDFQIHDDGYARILLLDRDMSERQAGRMLQRLFEIEAYRMMALLALPLARQMWPQLRVIERTLATLTDRIADNTGDDEALLQQLTTLAAQVERALAGSQSRFGASRAYHQLVRTRIGELREQRLRGLQTIDEFMTRRLDPAMATCSTVSQRLHDLSERVDQASSLLSTRVNIARERQNQMLLSATARRAKLQLRLQQTVEGLSLAAIVYYLAGLAGYLAKAAKAAGAPISPDLVVGLMVPLLAGAAVLVLRRTRHRLAEHAGDD